MINNSSRKTAQSTSENTSTGILYIVATPIGNRADMTLRAMHTLKEVDCILAEDTRHSKPLLLTLGIHTPLVSLHAHNEADKTDEIVLALQQGRSYALISDAGTPLICDPGFPLVKKARALGIPVTPIPGACALIAALSASGVPCDSFTFAGFLPAKQPARQVKLKALSTLEHTLIFYESSHRIAECLKDIETVFGAECELVLAKELTKTFEHFVPGRCHEILQWLEADKAHVKGEFVLMIPPRILVAETSHHSLLTLLLAELPLKQAVKIACAITNENKNDLYKMALEINAS